jgi:hypothetical protein
MPKGHINVKLLDAGGLGDADFIAAQRNGTLDELLESLSVKREFDHSNQLSYAVSGHLFHQIFGAPDIGHDIQNGNLFHYVGFGNSTTEYDYTFTEYTANMWQAFEPYIYNGTAYFEVKTPSTAIRGHKLTVEEDASGLRAAHDVQTWLWLPTAIVSNTISEFKITATDGEGDGWYVNDGCRTTVRTRLKDENGVGQTIAKTTNEVILAQWTLTMKII